MENPIQIYSNLFVCVDCAIFIANGDLSDESSPVRDNEILEGVSGELPFRWVVDSTGDSESFMKRPCDCCHSPLAGDRLAASLVHGG